MANHQNYPLNKLRKRWFTHTNHSENNLNEIHIISSTEEDLARSENHFGISDYIWRFLHPFFVWCKHMFQLGSAGVSRTNHRNYPLNKLRKRSVTHTNHSENNLNEIHIPLIQHLVLFRTKNYISKRQFNIIPYYGVWMCQFCLFSLKSNSHFWLHFFITIYM